MMMSSRAAANTSDHDLINQARNDEHGSNGAKYDPVQIIGAARKVRTKRVPGNIFIVSLYRQKVPDRRDVIFLDRKERHEQDESQNHNQQAAGIATIILKSLGIPVR